MNNMAQLKVELKKNDDGSVGGMLPSGLVCRWPCVWVDKFSEELTIEAFSAE